jgi:hypothetical protein
MPLDGCVISSNCSLSISAAISGSDLSARATPLVRARDPVMDTELALLPGLRDGTRCFAHAAVEHRCDLPDCLHPRAARAFEVRALRRADAAKVAFVDRHVSARLDHAFDAAAGDFLFVVVALFVAIVDARHRRVAPVDDLHVRFAIDEAALTDHHVAALAGFFEPQMREVRRRDVDGQRATAAEPRSQRCKARHLLHERRQILGARFADLIAQREQILVEVRRAYARAHVFLPHGDARLYLTVQTLLLGDNLGAGAAFRYFGGHWGNGESIRILSRDKSNPALATNATSGRRAPHDE